MHRPAVKKIKIPLGNGELLTNMFNQLVGTAVDISITYPKYVAAKRLCGQLVTVFEKFTNSPLMALPMYAVEKTEINAFCVKSRADINATFDQDLTDYSWNLNLVADDIKENFSKSYTDMKVSAIVNVFIVMCDSMAPYRKNFKDSEKLDHKFIICMADTEWCPFPFSRFNAKTLFDIQGVGEHTINFFMTVLNKAYEFSYGLYEILSSPDVDIDAFVDLIRENLEAIQKIPELSRCGRAFAKIYKSLDLLRTNFGDYYKDFLSTQDNTVIIQNFILDVSKQTGADIQLTGQFRKIIMYYRKISNSNGVSNPQITELTSQVDVAIKSFESRTQNLVRVRTGADSDADDAQDIPSTAISLTTVASDDMSARVKNQHRSVDDLVKEIEKPTRNL